MRPDRAIGRAGHPAHPHRSTRWALAMLGLVFLVGTLGFMLVEGWPAQKAMYFVVITLTTVGFSDEGISGAGRFFVAVLLVCGLAVASYTFALIVEGAFSSRWSWRFKMQAKIDKLDRHAIVCGYGRMGKACTEQLRDAGRQVVIIEKSETHADLAVADGLMVVIGNATDDDTLIGAGVGRATSLLCAADHVDNVVITLSARELNPALLIVARAADDEDARKMKRAGADRTVSPFLSGGAEMANAVVRPGLVEFVNRPSERGDAGNRSGPDVAMAELAVGAGSRLAGVTVADYGRAAGKRIAFIALDRPGQELRIPMGGADIFEPGDRVFVAGHAADVLRMSEDAGVAGRSADRHLTETLRPR